jgi:hypothetical protein
MILDTSMLVIDRAWISHTLATAVSIAATLVVVEPYGSADVLRPDIGDRHG